MSDLYARGMIRKLDDTAREIAEQLKDMRKYNSYDKINCKEHGAILDGVTDDTESLEGSVILMKDGLEFYIQGDVVISRPLTFTGLKNIRFRVMGTIYIDDNFKTMNKKHFIQFINCEKVFFEASINARDNTYYPDGTMYFPVLFTDCSDVTVDNTQVMNTKNIGGLSSSINAVNSSKANSCLHVKKLYVENTRSAVFTQYRHNTIENVIAKDTDDAIIALNSNNCLYNYINNCYAEKNPNFPLVAVENTPAYTVVENCIARNTRGLIEVFCVNSATVDAYLQRKDQLIVKDCKHILDDSTKTYYDKTHVQTISLRRGIEKHAFIRFENVQMINTSGIPASYFYIQDTKINADKVKLLEIINPVVVTNAIRDYVMLFNANIEKLVISNPYIENTGDSVSSMVFRHSRISDVIEELVVNGGIIKRFDRVFSVDNNTVANIIWTKATIKNLRVPSTKVMFYQTPFGNMSITNYVVGMLDKDYNLDMNGGSRVIINRDNLAPSIGRWRKGDMAVNLNNNQEWYYDGINWINRGFSQPKLPLTGAGAPSIIPSFIGQEYYDTDNRKKYEAFGVASLADWVAMN